MSTGVRQGDAANGQKKRRWLWPLLIISLGLNLLFVGLVAGRIWTHGYGGHPAARNRILTGAVERLMKDLPEAKRQHARELLRRHRESVKPVRQQIRKARRAAKDAVLTEPYDEAKVAKALALFREIRTGQHQSIHGMMMALMMDLSLEERKQLLDHIRAGFRHHRRRWRRHQGMPGGGAPRQPTQ
ncbi:MAG: periplasmic heavy metal sensor [Methyloligellaceae bacterium]